MWVPEKTFITIRYGSGLQIALQRAQVVSGLQTTQVIQKKILGFSVIISTKPKTRTSARFQLMYNLDVKTGNESHSLTRSSRSVSRQIASADTFWGFSSAPLQIFDM
jgi:hypothetical protein